MIKHHVIMWCMGKNQGIKLSRKIKELRKARGFTQEQLAELIETSYKYMQRMEGKTPPDIRLSTIVRLAKALNITLSNFLDFE